MPDLSPNMIRKLTIGAIAAVTLIAGVAIAPALLSSRVDAKEIVIAPPTGAPMSFADLIEKVSPAVVSIAVRSQISPDEQVPTSARWAISRHSGIVIPRSRYFFPSDALTPRARTAIR